jgi:hypothetical protein
LLIILGKESTRAGPAREPFRNSENGDADCADGTFIGKIRISSVEPATAIGDIITSTLARGVQVQPGDIVIYAGSNS